MRSTNMFRAVNAVAGLALVAALVPRPADAQSQTSAPAAADLAGAWSGTISHDGEETSFALELEPAKDGKLAIKATVPSIHLSHLPFGSVEPKLEGGEVHLGPFSFAYDAQAGTLTGLVPAGLVPVYKIPLVLHRVERVETPPRPEPAGALVQPVWTFDAGSPLWAGASFSSGAVYFGGNDGQVRALDARTGKERWSFHAGGAIRSRPTVSGDSLYVQADDGYLYKLAASSGKERWRVRVTDKPIERLPFDNPKSRYDRFGSDAAVAGKRLYLGTHDGRILALDPASGKTVWEFTSGDSVLAAPAIYAGRVYFGSFDKTVYALDAATGALVWRRPTEGALVSTPALAGGRLVIGNRAYDLLALDAKSGEVAWTRYVWFSWVESSASVRDGVAYVGSSDAADVFAFDVATGKRLWTADVFGWCWGEPALTDARVYVGTASQVGYPAGHRAGAMALDRKTGHIVWRYAYEKPASGAFGFPGSPALGDGLVFLTSLDGRVYAFSQ
jgi:outer membrane protein assembly factor BamB